MKRRFLVGAKVWGGFCFDYSRIWVESLTHCSICNFHLLGLIPRPPRSQSLNACTCSKPSPTRQNHDRRPRKCSFSILGGSWVITSGVLRRVTITTILSRIRGLLASRITTHEAPSSDLGDLKHPEASKSSAVCWPYLFCEGRWPDGISDVGVWSLQCMRMTYLSVKPCLSGARDCEPNPEKCLAVPGSGSKTTTGIQLLSGSVGLRD